MAIGLQLRVDQLPIHFDLEPAAVRGNQRHRFDTVLVIPEQFLNQAHGPGGVVSNCTVGDLYFEHGFLRFINVRKL